MPLEDVLRREPVQPVPSDPLEPVWLLDFVEERVAYWSSALRR